MLPSRPIIIVTTRVDVGLERDELQIEHQVDVVGVERPGCRSACRWSASRPVMSCSAFSMRRSISRIDDRYSSSLRRSAGAEIGRRARVVRSPTRSRMLRRYSSRRARASGDEARVDVAEQPLEDQARIGFRRHRRRRAAPGEAVGVGAASSRSRSCRPCASRRSRARATRSASAAPRCCAAI